MSANEPDPRLIFHGMVLRRATVRGVQWVYRYLIGWCEG